MPRVLEALPSRKRRELVKLRRTKKTPKSLPINGSANPLRELRVPGDATSASTARPAGTASGNKEGVMVRSRLAANGGSTREHKLTLERGGSRLPRGGKGVRGRVSL